MATFTNQTKNSVTMSNLNKVAYGSNILLENDSAILLENGDNLLTEAEISYSISFTNQSKT